MIITKSIELVATCTIRISGTQHLMAAEMKAMGYVDGPNISHR